MSFVDLRPSAILRYKLGVLQGSSDIKLKRQYIGASLYLSAMSLPVMLLIGVILCYIFPYVFKISSHYIEISRTAVFCVAVILGLKSFLGVPEAILRGNNLEYKGFFIEPIRNLVYVGLIVITLYFDHGILGVIFASFASFLISTIFRLAIQIRELPELSPLKPDRLHMTEMSSRGGWYLFSSFAFQTLQSLDVIIIGIFLNPVLVTVFSLTKSLSFRVSESLVTISGSIGSGLAELVGNGETVRLVEMRANVLRINSIIGVIMFLYFNSFNEQFVKLWVGESNYAGSSVNFFLSLTIPFIILSMSSQLFMDAYLKFKEKSLAVVSSSVISILVGIVSVNIWGIVGVASSILLGRVILWIQFEMIINKQLPMTLTLAKIIKSFPAFLIVICLSIYFNFENPILVSTWFDYIYKSGVYLAVISTLMFLLVLKLEERKLIFRMIKSAFCK